MSKKIKKEIKKYSKQVIKDTWLNEINKRDKEIMNKSKRKNYNVY